MKNKIIGFNNTNEASKIANLIVQFTSGDTLAKDELIKLGFEGFANFHNQVALDNFLSQSPLIKIDAPVYYKINVEFRIQTEYDLVWEILHEITINFEHIKSSDKKMFFLARNITEKGKTGIEIYICDNGQGIPDILFYAERGNSATGLSWRGRGLGFSIGLARSDDKGYLEIGTKNEKFRFDNNFLPTKLKPEITNGTLIRLVRFFE